jgi:hypothetical protein
MLPSLLLLKKLMAHFTMAKVDTGHQVVTLPSMEMRNQEIITLPKLLKIHLFKLIPMSVLNAQAVDALVDALKAAQQDVTAASVPSQLLSLLIKSEELDT